MRVLEVFERFSGNAAEAPYFVNYEQWPWPWELAVGDVDGEPVVPILKRGANTWTPYSAIRFERRATAPHLSWPMTAG